MFLITNFFWKTVYIKRDIEVIIIRKDLKIVIWIKTYTLKVLWV